MKKKKLWLLLLIPILLFGAFGFYFYAGSVDYLKVTDPLDPRFNPDEFVFNDYKSNKELAKALKILIQPGMPLKEAERFLDGSPDKRGGRDVTYEDLFFRSPSLSQLGVENLRQTADKVLFYQNGGNNKVGNPVFIGWKVIVFYDEDDLVMQIIVLDQLLF